MLADLEYLTVATVLVTVWSHSALKGQSSQNRMMLEHRWHFGLEAKSEILKGVGVFVSCYAVSGMKYAGSQQGPATWTRPPCDAFLGSPGIEVCSLLKKGCRWCLDTANIVEQISQNA